MKDLLLLHGAIGSAAQFAALKDNLRQNFNVHAPDFSGHGGKALPEKFSIARFADDVLEYLSDHKLTSVNIFGYSMGGYVALYLAKHHPQQIGKIFTLATKFNWAPEIAFGETKMLDAGKIEEKIPAFAKQLEQRHYPADWKMVLQKTAGMMIDMGNDAPLKPQDYKNITQKILVGLGDKDQMVTFEETVSVYRSLPNGALIVFPETPHPIEKVNVSRLASEVTLFFT